MVQLQHEHVATHPHALHSVRLEGDYCELTLSPEDGDDVLWPLTSAAGPIVLSGPFDAVRRDVRAMLTILDAARRATTKVNTLRVG